MQNLVELVIEDLECMKPTPKANYDYVVLQATDNSIPFYESLGFVRVGAVMRDLDETNHANGFVSNSTETYTVSSGETLKSIASKLDVDVWEFLFLNRHLVGEAKQSDRPYLNTTLLVPCREKPHAKTEFKAAQNVIRWHVAKEDETPRTIARLYDVGHDDVVRANRNRLPTLLSNSRLKSGTRIRVSHFDAEYAEFKAYAHWSFPDKLYDEPEPSYMVSIIYDTTAAYSHGFHVITLLQMVRKLNRRKPSERALRPHRNSLDAPVIPYERPDFLVPPSPSSLVSDEHDSPESFDLKPPAKPPSAYTIFAREQREKAPAVASIGVLSIRDRWKQLSNDDQERYKVKAKDAEKQYMNEKKAYDEMIASAAKKSDAPPPVPPSTASTNGSTYSLYNKVVRLKPGAVTEDSEYTYWYVSIFVVCFYFLLTFSFPISGMC